MMTDHCTCKTIRNGRQHYCTAILCRLYGIVLQLSAIIVDHEILVGRTPSAVMGEQGECKIPVCFGPVVILHVLIVIYTLNQCGSVVELHHGSSVKLGLLRFLLFSAIAGTIRIVASQFYIVQIKDRTDVSPEMGTLPTGRCTYDDTVAIVGQFVHVYAFCRLFIY